MSLLPVICNLMAMKNNKPLGTAMWIWDVREPFCRKFSLMRLSLDNFDNGAKFSRKFFSFFMALAEESLRFCTRTLTYLRNIICRWKSARFCCWCETWPRKVRSQLVKVTHKTWDSSALGKHLILPIFCTLTSNGVAVGSLFKGDFWHCSEERFSRNKFVVRNYLAKSCYPSIRINQKSLFWGNRYLNRCSTTSLSWGEVDSFIKENNPKPWSVFKMWG